MRVVCEEVVDAGLKHRGSCRNRGLCYFSGESVEIIVLRKRAL